ncbi:MAG: bifunctional nicotinamidase/pyrazinamidase [Spirochaetota bacterium]
MQNTQTSQALLIVDVQVDFCTGGALEVKGGEGVVPTINALIPQFSHIVATQDWHPAGHFSFASSHQGKAPFDTVPFHGEDQILWPDHCVIGSPGAGFHPDLNTDAVHLMLRKGTNKHIDSYSAFYENDHATPTGLTGWLREHGINHITLCGLAADVCVYFTALDGLACGFSVSLVQEATRGIDTPPGSLKLKMDELKSKGVQLI